MTHDTGHTSGIRYGAWALGIGGLALLAALLVRSDLGQVSKALQGANLPLVVASVALILSRIFIKDVEL